MSAVERWIDRGTSSLSELVDRKDGPDARLLRAVRHGEPLGLATVGDVLYVDFVNPISGGARREVLRRLIDEATRERLGITPDVRRRPGARPTGDQSLRGAAEVAPGSWMASHPARRRVRHAASCTCPRCRDHHPEATFRTDWPLDSGNDPR